MSSLRYVGIHAEPRPQVDDSWDDAHAELPQLNAGNRKTNEAEELKSRLAEIGQLLPVEGPFYSNPDS